MTLSVPLSLAGVSLASGLLSVLGFPVHALRAGMLMVLCAAALPRLPWRACGAAAGLPQWRLIVLVCGAVSAAVAVSSAVQGPSPGGLPAYAIRSVYGERSGQESGRPGSWTGDLLLSSVASRDAQATVNGGRIRLWSVQQLPASGSSVLVDLSPGASLSNRIVPVTDSRILRGPGPAAAALHGVRSALRRRLQMHSHSDTGLAHALILGDRDGLDPELSRRIRLSGLSHVLALSGMHLGLIAGAIGLAARAIPHRLPRVLLPVVAAAGFVVLAGPSASLVRALLVLGIYSAFRIAGLPGRAANVLPLAFALQVLVRPWDIADLGFLLSWAAVIGIALVLGWSGWRRMGRVPAGLLVPLTVSLGAWLATAPIAAIAFGRLPLAGLILSVAAGPLVSLLMLCAVATTIIPGSLGPLSFGLLSRGLARIAETGAAMPAMVFQP